MSEKESLILTGDQRKLLIDHLYDIDSRATSIIEEAVYLMSASKTMRIILKDAKKLTNYQN